MIQENRLTISYLIELIKNLNRKDRNDEKLNPRVR